MSNILGKLRPDFAPIRHSREFRLLYTGQGFSSAGVMVCYVALPYQAYQLTHSSLMPRLVPHADLPGAAALSGLLGTASQVGGPLIGGALLTGGLPLAYAAGGLTCALAAAPFAAMAPSPPAEDAGLPSLRGLAEGLNYARSRPDLLGTYLIDIGAMFFGAPYAVFPQLAAGLGGPAVLALLYAAPGLGSALISLTSSWTRHVHRHGRAIALAVGGWGVSIGAFAFAPDLALAVLALAAAGASDMVSGIFRMTMWNQTIPARVRGRLAGLEMISYTTGEPLGNLETGAVAALTGSVRAAVLSGGVLSVLGAVIVTLALPALWRYDARLSAPVPGDQAGAGTGSGAVTVAVAESAASSAALARHQSCPDSGSR